MSCSPDGCSPGRGPGKRLPYKCQYHNKYGKRNTVCCEECEFNTHGNTCPNRCYLAN